MIFTSDNYRSAATFLHEWGHAFANLADEYYSSTVAYTEFYPPGIEPHEANITALLDPDAVKWKHLLTPGIEVPTYWGQDQIEELEARIKETQESKASSKDDLGTVDSDAEGSGNIDELKRQIQQIRDHYQELYQGKIGVFEGAGYTSKGLFRSEVHVGMFHEGEYGKVSEEAILKVIQHLTDLEN
jgi:hypothetical protein